MKKQLVIKLAQLFAVLLFVAFTSMHFSSIHKAGDTDFTTGDAVISPDNQNSDTKPGKKIVKKDASGSQNVEIVAPKQAEIAKKVDVDKRYYLLAGANDTEYLAGNQWDLEDINVASAWDISANSDDVIVADIDTGYALAHEDLVNQWYTNAGEVGGGKETNGIDDDGNGYVDDWRGWDFYNVDNNPQAGSINPSGSGVEHGTETAGLIGATTNNNKGIASVSGGATIMPLQVMNDNGSGYSSDIVAAIYYATDNGADVINMSLGTSGDDSAVSDAVDYAVENNVVVIAAAGNCGNNDQDACSGQVDGYVTFPARYNKVVAVGAVNQSGSRASFSSYGQRVDIVAPGSGTMISTTYSSGNPTQDYSSELYGTSFASPMTAGAAALIRSIRPDSSVDDVRALLMASTSHLAGMSGKYYTSYYGHGLLDVGKSVAVADDLNGITESEPTLYQAGSNKGDSQFRSSQNFGSGCNVASGTWCTVWLRNADNNYDRFLPYQQTDGNSEAGWTWSGTILQHGEWSVRAMQGETVSATPKLLFKK